MDDYNIKLQRLATSVRSASLSKPQVASLSTLGIEIRASDWQTDGPEKLDQLFSGSDIVISTVNSEALLDQKILVDTAKRANVQRFIPCDFGNACIPGVTDINDEVKSCLMKSINAISDPCLADIGNQKLYRRFRRSAHIHRRRFLVPNYCALQRSCERSHPRIGPRILWRWGEKDCNGQ